MFVLFNKSIVCRNHKKRKNQRSRNESKESKEKEIRGKKQKESSWVSIHFVPFGPPMGESIIAVLFPDCKNQLSISRNISSPIKKV